MIHERSTSLPRRRLGSHGPLVTPLGLGCFGLSNAYGKADPVEAEATIRRGLELGCNLLDTADIYGAGHNEELVGRAIRSCRDQVVVGTKVGFICNAAGEVVGRDASPAYVRTAAEASLRRLGTDVIDLYTLHRVDPKVPLEETIGAMAELVAEGKVRYLGLSEANPDQIRRASAVHRIATLQSEYSLWTREPERDVLPVCRELGIAFVSFAPLGRGLLSGTVPDVNIEQGDFRRSLPRFQPEGLGARTELVRRLNVFAKERDLTPSQVSLSWILNGGENMFAIPGTRRREHLEDNFGALNVPPWDLQDRAEIDTIFPPGRSFGERYAAGSIFAPC